MLGMILRPIGFAPVQHMQADEPHHGQREPRGDPTMTERNLGARRAGDPGAMGVAHLERDLGPRVAQPDDGTTPAVS
jgi:hypothetical protein